MNSFKLLFLIVIFITTCLSGCYPFFKKHRRQSFNSAAGEAIATGIFLGAGLIHMLGDASRAFYRAHADYPISFLLAGSVLIVLLLIEHIAHELHNPQKNSVLFTFISVLMLSVHSFFAGAALGLSQTLSVSLMIGLAILGHKWAASFALSVQINKSSLTLRKSIWLFAAFACMTPLGILCGQFTLSHLQHHPLIEPTILSLAAGTFLYLGTLHGLEQSILVKQCCNLKFFLLAVLGFVIMAFIAIWT